MAVKDKLKPFLVAILVAHIDGVLSQGTCEQGDLKSEYRLSVRDVDTHVLTATGMSDYGVAVIKAMSEDADKYTDIIAGATSLQVFLKDVQQFEETTVSEKNAHALRIELVNFDGSCPIQKVDFRIQIIDTNNNNPQFTDKYGDAKDTFVVTVPMPFPKNVELQSCGTKIYAKDVDLTNTRVSFSIEPEDDGDNDLDVQYGGVVDDLNKIHSAILRSTATLSYTERRYTLTVEDEGRDVKYRTIGTLIVRRQDEACIVASRFERSSYLAKFTDNLLEDLIVTVLDGNEKLIIIVEDGKKKVKWDNKEDAIFTLRIDDVSLPFPVETVVIVRIEQVDQPEAPRFEKSSYRGTYKNGQLSVPIIRLLGDGQGDVRFKDAEMDRIFSVKNDNGLVIIKKIGPLQPDVKEIRLTLIAHRGGLDGSTEVLIKIIKDRSSCEGDNKNAFVFVGNRFVIENLHVEL